MTNDEMKQETPQVQAAPPNENKTEQPQSTQVPPKKPRSSSGSGKKAGSEDRVHASTAETGNNGKSTGNAKTGTGQAGNKKAKKEQVDLKSAPPRSDKPAHRIIPFLLLGLAVFITVCLIVNLVANGGTGENKFASDPSTHPMGSAGYYLCHALFGAFGPAAFLLPVLLVNMAFFWKAYIDHRLVSEKAICSLALLILVSTMIHVFCLSAIHDRDSWLISAEDLIRHGAAMTGGGLLGGGIGYFFVRYLNIAGGIIVSIFLTALALFFFLGMTPQHLLERFRTRRNLRAGKKKPLGVDEEEDYIKEQMQQKHTRAAANATKPANTDHAVANRPPEGAVAYRNEPMPTKKKIGDELAPMPMPFLDATDETPADRPLYVPEELELETTEKKAEIQPAQKPVEQPASPPRPTNPALRREEEKAVDSVFPRNDSDLKSVQKVQKSDRNFELSKIFVDLDDHPRKPSQPKPRHAPLPPEVPMPGSSAPMRSAPVSKPAAPTTAPAANPAAARPRTAAPTAAAPARPTPMPAPAARPTAGTPASAARPAAAAASASAAPSRVGANRPNAPAAGPVKNQPIYRQAPATQPKEYGLSSEEFEKREAAVRPLPRTAAGAKPAAASAAKAGTASAAKKPAEKKPTPAEPENKPYIFPPISYLHPGEPMTAENQAEIAENMRKLSTTLDNFNIRVNEITYSCGPTVTRYEIFPAAGVRVRSIMNLSDDIALSFAVQGVRMETIDGKSAIGVEVPNTTRCTVYLRDLIDNKKFSESKNMLTAGLGADITGTPLHFDIAKMPHLLVAGTTGSGKSICINCIIMSILYRARPDQVKLIMIDPKKIEFKRYKGIPHLMAPVITASKDAAGALQAAVNEMEDRFTRIQDVGASNIDGYNKAADKDPELPHMPHIVIIIDELADLMMTARDEVEESICRLAQKARAAGMHIIVGTQRPSVDVVTGLIKSNIPSRIACTVRSQIDSRTILDFSGAEKLLGKGDMLFAPIGAMRPTRVQGAFVSDDEVEKICEFIRATNGSAVYNESFTSKMKEYSESCGNKKGKGGDGEVALPSSDGGDNKYVDAIRVFIEENKVSTSLLQRRLEIGYGRAARIIDRMEKEGLVSKQEGSKPRSILITAEQFIERYVEGDAGKDAEDV